MAIKAFSYLRVSGKGQIGNDGFPRQRQTIAKFAKANRFEVVQEFTDEGVSGTKDKFDRPGLTDLFVALKANGVKVVLLENPTRLARDVVVSEIILSEFKKIGVKVLSADGGIDLTVGSEEPTGDLIRQILAAISQWERVLIVQKLRASRLRIRRSGERCEGRKPYGTTPEEKATVGQILALSEAGKSDGEIANHLNESGVSPRTKSRAGKVPKWHRMMVYRIVQQVQKK
jgi:DNA invertase Pin-like site-specific DNA recombinase